MNRFTRLAPRPWDQQERQQSLGTALAAGRFNVDQFSDLAVGVPGALDTGRAPGAIYGRRGLVYFGATLTPSIIAQLELVARNAQDGGVQWFPRAVADRFFSADAAAIGAPLCRVASIMRIVNAHITVWAWELGDTAAEP